MSTAKELLCIDALKEGVDAQLTTDGITNIVWRVFAADDEPAADDEDRLYPAIEVVWNPLVPIGYRTTHDSTVQMVLRVITHHSADQKGETLADIYASVRAAIDSYDFAGALTSPLTQANVLVTDSDSGIEGKTRYLELTLDWRVCG